MLVRGNENQHLINLKAPVQRCRSCQTAARTSVGLEASAISHFCDKLPAYGRNLELKFRSPTNDLLHNSRTKRHAMTDQ
ncbi:hypothetical protein ACHWQZ_G012329 [Mnemiopsis leidyi]